MSHGFEELELQLYDLVKRVNFQQHSDEDMAKFNTELDKICKMIWREINDLKAKPKEQELYPELKGDLLIGLWKRIHYFAQNCARERKAALHFVKLEESFPHDYCWIASVEMNAGGIEDPDIVKYKGYGIEAHEAMLDLFHKVKEDLPEK